jgi:TRAP-type C4-dicarboxylate transport system substrate-binding protein
MPEIKRAVQQGQVPIGEVLMVTLVNENPVYAIDGLPFLASSHAEARKLWTVQRPVVERLLDAQGLMLLYAVPWPGQGLFVPREINGVADMAGLNWRAYDRQTARMGELFKARPVTIQAAEIIANKAAFNALDKASQTALLAEARKAEEAGWAASARVAESTRAQLASNGMRVSAPSAKLVAELSAIGNQLVDEWLAGAGPEGKALLEAYRKP